MEEIMRLGLGIIVALGLTLPAFGQTVDPLIGTWKMNLEKSTSVGRSLPKSEILNWTGEGQTLIDTIDEVDAQGRAFKQVNVHIYDGMPHPTTGNPNYDASAYTRTGNTINVIRFKNGKPVGFGQAIIDPGKTYTFTIAGIANNQPYYSVVVYDRQ
jgi:hypothetical protein